MNELINILIEKNQSSLLKKYNLTIDKVGEIKKSLQQGKWKFVN
jgi:hypothetical protein